MQSIISILEKNSQSHRAIWKFPAENRQMSFPELYQLAESYSLKLSTLGIGKQDRVGLILNNNVDYVALLIAIWRINAIAVPIRPKGSKYTDADNHLLYCDQICDFNLLIYGDTATTETFSSWMSVPGKLSLSLSGFKSLQTSLHHLQNAPIGEDDIAILQFSSGSTGNPKGVIVTHAMVMTQLDNICDNYGQTSRGGVVRSMASWAPINHDLGLFIGVLKPLYSNCHNVLAPPNYYMRNPPRWFSLLSENQVNLTFTTNSALASTLKTLRRLQQRTDIDLSRLHMYIVAEKVSPAVVRQCQEIFPPLKMPPANLHVGYGMAENTLGAVCTREQKLQPLNFSLDENNKLTMVARPNTDSFELVNVGTPDKGNIITIRAEDDKILPELTLGEINITSPCVSPGYFNNPEQTQLSFNNGRFRTGDLGFYYQKQLYFYSRKDDMICVGGRNIVPNDVEELAESLGFLRPGGTCLIARENTRDGTQELMLLVECSDCLDAQSLAQFRVEIQGIILSAQEILISRILFCVKGSIEKTSSGKKRRKVIKERLLNHEINLLGQKYASEATL